MKTKNIITGVVQGLLSLALLMSGVMKMMTPYEELAAQMPWANSFSPMMVIIIGLLEVLGVIGMNLPFLIKRYKNLVPLASGGLALTMLGAVATHITLGENFVPPLVLLLLAVYVTYSRKELFKSKTTRAVA